MKNIYIHQHSRLGDMILCNGLIRILSKKNVSEIMHTGNKLPIIKEKTLMDKAIIIMTKKSFGCLGIISNKGNLIGIITDGDLRR